MNPISPKLPNILTGRERYRDSAAIVAARAALGLGTMATQNASSVNIAGGTAALTSLNATTITGTTGNITNVNATAVSATTVTATNGRFAAGWYSTSLAVGGTNPTSTLDSQGTLGVQTAIVTTSGVLSGAYTNILLDAAGSVACGGTISAADCTTYTSEATCNANSSHGGCVWSGGNPCSDYDATDATTCESGHSGCVWDTAPCSDYDGDQGTCETTAGCSWNDCTAQGDESSCTSVSGCSWDGVECTGSNCSGTYELGTCSGTWGACSGTASCAGIANETDCNAETGCAWAALINVELPPIVDGRTYGLKNINSSGYDAIIAAASGETVEFGSNYTLTDYNDAIQIVGKYRTASCAGFVTEGACTPAGCVWLYSDCSSTVDGETECLAQEGCSWNSGDGICEGVYDTSCGGSYVVSKNWYIMGNAGI